MLLVILPVTLINVSITIGRLGISLNLVVHKFTFNDFLQFGQIELALSFSLSINKLAYISVSIAVFNGPLTPEMSHLELACILLFSKSVDSLSMFFPFGKFSLISTTIRLSHDSLPMFLAMSKITFVLNWFIQIPEVSFTMELIMFKISLIFQHTSHGVLAVAVFLSCFIEFSVIRSSISFFNSPMTHFILIELTSKLFPVVKDKLTISSHFDSILHLSLID